MPRELEVASSVQVTPQRRLRLRRCSGSKQQQQPLRLASIATVTISTLITWTRKWLQGTGSTSASAASNEARYKDLDFTYFDINTG